MSGFISSPYYLAPNYSTEALAFFARLANQPNVDRKLLYENCIRSLVGAGVWSRLDVLYLFAADTPATALTNLKSASFPATAVNAPLFLSNNGYSLTGSSNHRISSTFNPNSGGLQFVQNSASMFAWCGTAIPTTPDGGGIIVSMYENVGGSNLSFIYPRSYPDTLFGVVNGSASIGPGAVADARGLLHMSRTGANAMEMFKNGVSVATGSGASAAPENNTMTFGAIQTAERYTGAVLAGGAGAGLNSTQALALYDAIHIYLQAVAGVS